jgi:hypothetical protein
MTEGYGSGYDEESGQRPSGRGAVTERLARQSGGGAREIDLTEEAAADQEAAAAGDQDDRTSSGTFEPATPASEDAGITPTPVPAADEPAEPVQGLPEPPAATESAPAASAAEGQGGPPASLLGALDAGDIRNRFLDIQAGFVDEPRQAVEEAARFVDDLVRQVVEALQSQRGQVTSTTAEGSTEDLRLALRAYRQFVDRLLGLAS